MSRSKVQGQGYKVQKTRCALTITPHAAVWTEWSALVAGNVAHAADAAIRSLQRGVFAGMRELGLAPAGYR